MDLNSYLKIFGIIIIVSKNEIPRQGNKQFYLKIMIVILIKAVPSKTRI